MPIHADNNTESALLAFMEVITDPEKYKAKVDNIKVQAKRLVDERKKFHSAQAATMQGKENLQALESEYESKRFDLKAIERSIGQKVEKQEANKVIMAETRKELDALKEQLEKRESAIILTEQTLDQGRASLEKELVSLATNQAKAKAESDRIKEFLAGG